MASFRSKPPEAPVPLTLACCQTAIVEFGLVEGFVIRMWIVTAGWLIGDGHADWVWFSLN